MFNFIPTGSVCVQRFANSLDHMEPVSWVSLSLSYRQKLLSDGDRVMA